MRKVLILICKGYLLFFPLKSLQFFSFWHLAEDCQLTNEIKSLCGVNLLLFVSFAFTWMFKCWPGKWVWVIYQLPCCHLLIILSKLQVRSVLPILPNGCIEFQQPPPYLFFYAIFLRLVVMKPRAAWLHLMVFLRCWGGGRSRLWCTWMKFLSCLVSPHSPTPSPLNPQTHIFLYAHWRLPLMHLLQIFATRLLQPVC